METPHMHKYNYSMALNPQCSYQNCASGCCNFYGDCPQWYTNGIERYTDCYYYYSTKPTNVSAAVFGSIVGVLLIIVIICVCYRFERKKRQEQLKRLHENGNVNFKFANQSVVTISDSNQPQQSNYKARKNGQVYPLNLHNQHIFGIGNQQVS